MLFFPPLIAVDYDPGTFQSDNVGLAPPYPHPGSVPLTAFVVTVLQTLTVVVTGAGGTYSAVVFHIFLAAVLAHILPGPTLSLCPLGSLWC